MTAWPGADMACDGARSAAPTLAIVDPCTPAPYGPGVAGTPPGGTEATVLKVAGALATGRPVDLYQSARTEAARTGGVQAFPLVRADTARCGALMVINSWKVACRLAARHPGVPVILWLHVHPGRHNRPMGPALHAAGIEVVCVSESHARALRAFLAGGAAPAIRHVWNPVADGLAPDATPRDPDLLVFASSPHKGLAEVLGRFADLRRRMPALRLEVADPGYLRWPVGEIPGGVTLLGPLPHGAVIDRFRRALCLFMAQSTFRETFGLVLAEANAVGTPVLAQAGLGANDEVLGAHPGQCIDVADLDAVEVRLRAWQDRRPNVTGHEGFRLACVAGQWAGLLDRAMTDRTQARGPADA